MNDYKAKCENCKLTKMFSDTMCSYKLSDGSTVRIIKTFAWCSNCSEVVWAETIPSLESLRQERLELESPSKETVEYLTFLADGHSTYEEELEYTKTNLDRQISWRESRKSAPRCLSCGATEIVQAKKGETNSGNPKWEFSCNNCNGVIRVLSQPVLSLNRGWVLFTSEGLIEGGYEMSPSKGAIPNKKVKP